MQVYSVLEELTARPGADEIARAPHLLYGHVEPSRAYSTGAWMREVEALRAAGVFDGRIPIFVGGTGLYFKALEQGISAMPDIPDAVRTRWRERLAEDGPQTLHTELTRRDPQAARGLRPSDSQRLVRALEVFDASGRSILAWQAGSGTPLIDRASARFLVLDPPRQELVERIDRRFDAMMAGGAMAEARAVGALGLDPKLPAMKAIGVRQLLDADAGMTTLAEAVSLAKIATRQYAKRQATWFRHQLGPHWLRAASAEAVDILQHEIIVK